MLREVIVEVTPVHQIQYEAQFVRRVESVRHAHDEWTVHLKQIKLLL